MDKVCVFLHGKESGPRGTKLGLMGDIATSLGWKEWHPDFSGLHTLQERAEVLRRLQLESHEVVLVGSSMGGLLAATEAPRYPHLRGIFLLAPAFFIPELHAEVLSMHETERVPVEVVMGWEDDIVNPQLIVGWGLHARANLHLVHDNHRLSGSHALIAAVFQSFLENLDGHR